jgi:hypothetical protein
MITSKSSISTSAAFLKRKRAKAPLVVTDVRRSDRLKGKTMASKQKHVSQKTVSVAQQCLQSSLQKS